MNDFSKYIRQDRVIKINYADAGLPESVRMLKPTLYHEGNGTYCCILGPDPQAGIFGCGHSPEAALQSWDDAYKQLLEADKQLKDKNDSVKALFHMWVAWKNTGS
jgi:hypothetical protein